MTVTEFPSTLGVEYKDISLLLSAMTRGATSGASFYILALAAFGLSYSATPKEAEYFSEILKNRILSIDIHSSLVVEDAEALGFAVHAFVRQRKWNAALQKHEKNLLAYYQKIEESQWLRSPDVATSFLLGFSSLTAFQVLSAQARKYLLQELGESANGHLPVPLLGLSLNGGIKEVDQTSVRKWLERTHLPFKHVCMLAVALNDLDSPLSVEATNRFRLEISGVYSEIVDSNISLVRALLAITHIAAMGENTTRIINAFKYFPVDEAMRDRIVSVIQSDAHLFIEFREDLLAHPPAIDFLAFYLFATRRLGLADAYVIDSQMKVSFQEFLKLWRGVGVRTIDQRALLALIFTTFVVCVAVLLQVWLPISDWLYNLIMKAVDSALLASFLDDILKWAVLFPMYLIFGSLMGIWLYGRSTWHDISPGGVITNMCGIIKSIRTQR